MRKSCCQQVKKKQKNNRNRLNQENKFDLDGSENSGWIKVLLEWTSTTEHGK